MVSLKFFKFKYILLVFVIVSIITSFLMEYQFNLVPCKLCLYQRYIWIILLIFSFILVFQKSYFYKITLFFSLFWLILILFIGVYHSLVELGYISNFISCSQNTKEDIKTIEELDKLIRKTSNNDCAFVKFKILGLTLSNLSVIVSFFLTILNLITIKNILSYKYEKK